MANFPFKKNSSLVRLDEPFANMQKAINSLFDDFWGERTPGALSGFGGWNQPSVSFSPKVNIKEAEDRVKITAELPGMEERDIEVTLDREYLTIKGEKKSEKEEEKKGTHYYECSYGSFQRSIPLPYEVDREKVVAVFKNGVLKVDLEKAPMAKSESRKISVKTV